MATLDMGDIAEIEEHKASTAPEAAVEPSAPVDPSTLNELDKQYYDVWREQNPTAPLTYDVTQSFGYYQDALDDPTNVNAYRALITPSLVKPMTYTDPETGKVTSYRVVTPEAIEMMGGTFALSGSGKGDVYILPGGTKGVHNSTFASQDITEGAYAGMMQAVSQGNPADQFSVLGSVGLDDEFAELVPDEWKPAVDVALAAAGAPVLIPGVTDSLIMGTEWAQGTTLGLSKVTGLKPQEIQTIESVGKVVAQGILIASGVGAPIAAGIEATAQANAVAAGQQKWGEALASTVVYAASVATGNLYASAALNAGYSAMRGEETKNIVESAIWSVAAGYAGQVNPHGNLLVNAVRTQVDPNYTNSDFAASAIVAGVSKKPLTTKTDFAGANKAFFDVTADNGSLQVPGGPLVKKGVSDWWKGPPPEYNDAVPVEPGLASAEDPFSSFTPEAYYKPKYV